MIALSGKFRQGNEIYYAKPKSMQQLPVTMKKTILHNSGNLLITTFLGIWSARGGSWLVKGLFFVFVSLCISSIVSGCISNTAKDTYKDAFEKFQAGDYVAAIAAYDQETAREPLTTTAKPLKSTRNMKKLLSIEEWLRAI